MTRIGHLPPDEGWTIWIGYYERNNWPGYLGSNPFAYLPGPENTELRKIPRPNFNGQASFQVVKKLFIQVIRCRVPEVVENGDLTPAQLRPSGKSGRSVTTAFPGPPPS